MPNATSLRPDDPSQIGSYRILDRLGAGGQGVVYLAESRGGDRVAIKVLRSTGDPEEDALFRHEAEVLPQIASFCTAQVLEVSAAGTTPYIVSEFIEGPTLQRAVAERGPMRGRELRRVAVGTITALAAIHRAGVVHRDFKPANVLLSRDGPRVIDFGIARTIDAEATQSEIVGTPSYMSPEHAGGTPPGPPADVFAWGSVMVFAATGHPPFGTDGFPAIMRRIVMEEPDLRALDDELRDIVAACLAKDAAARPQAGQVLFRLLGHPGGAPRTTTSVNLLSEGTAAATGGMGTTGPVSGGLTGPAGRSSAPTGTPGHEAGVSYGSSAGGPAGSEAHGVHGVVPARRGRGRRLALVSVAMVGAVVAAATIFFLTRGAAPLSPGSDTPSSAAVGPAPTASAGPLVGVDGKIDVGDLRATFHERPSDPVRLTSFIVKKSALSYPAYVRVADGTGFRRLPDYRVPVVSPDGTMVAAVYQQPQLVPDNGNAAWFTDRAGREMFHVATVDAPYHVREPRWSRDGRRLLLTVYAFAGRDSSADKTERTVGFAVVDVAARTSAFTLVDDVEAAHFPYLWGPDGSSVVRAVSTSDSIRFFDLDGRVLRTLKNARSPDGVSQEFSPSGRLMSALCPGDALAACVLDSETGRLRARFALPSGGSLWDWFDEEHLMVLDRRGSRWKTVIVDLTGRTVRTYAEFTPVGDSYWWLNFSPK